MPRKITQKRRLSKRKQRKDKPRRKTRGGSGAAAYMTQVAGDMHNQHGVNGLLKYTPIQGGGGVSAATQAAGFADKLNNQMGGVGAEMAVPVVLMLANQVAPKILRGQRGGVTPLTADESTLLAHANAERSDDDMRQGVNTVNHIDPNQEFGEGDAEVPPVPHSPASNPQIFPPPVPGTVQGTVQGTVPGTEETEGTNTAVIPGGGMLETIAVPAALVLASNYFGKRSRRAVPPQNRYTRK